MEGNGIENLSGPEQELEKLRNSLIELISEHNKNDSNRKVEPIKHFGEPSGGVRLYWAHWHDDQRSTHMVGFVYNQKSNKLEDFGTGKHTKEVIFV